MAARRPTLVPLAVGALALAAVVVSARGLLLLGLPASFTYAWLSGASAFCF